MNDVSRVLATLRLLHRDWATLKDLAALGDCSTKTVRRDLAAIRKAGFVLRVKVDPPRKLYRLLRDSWKDA